MDSLINQFNTACKEGNLEQVKYLINKFDLDVNKKDNIGNTGFHYACINGHLPIVEYCIKIQMQILIFKIIMKKLGFIQLVCMDIYQQLNIV